MLSSIWKETGLDTVPPFSPQFEWEKVSQSFRRELLLLAEEYLNFSWPFLSATRYLDFAQTGNRSAFEEAYFKRRQALALLALAECLENKGRFLDDIINGVWCICEESSWVLPAHHNQFYADGGRHRLPRTQEPVIDLFAAETAALLAWIKYLLGPSLEAITPEVMERISYELKKRILTPYLARDDFWWMGFRVNTGHTLGNWVPWITGNCLRVFLLMEEEGAHRRRAVLKGLRSLDIYLRHYSPDGGCDEGPSYWGRSGGSLFECLEMLWEVTGGVFNPFTVPLIKKIGQYMYHVRIARDYFVNFADSGSQAEVDGPLLYAYGKRIDDPNLMSVGAQMYQLFGLKKLIAPQTFSLGRLIRASCLHAEIKRYEWRKGHVEPDHWFDRLQLMIARETEDPERGFFLAAKGGHNGENHNHNDVGSCIVFFNGRPLLIDVGVETYTAKTFGPGRYEIWTMRSAYHNLPLVNGYEQAPGRKYQATDVQYRCDEKGSQVSMQLGKAYPEAAGIREWERSYRLQRAPEPAVLIRERFKLEDARSLQLILMLPHQPRFERNLLYLTAGAELVKMTYDPAQWDLSWELLPLDDPLLQALWGERLYRLCLTMGKPSRTGEITLILQRK